MTTRVRILASSTCLLPALLISIARAAGPATQPVDNGWQATLLDYQRPRHLIVQATTPTPAQVDMRRRPSTMPADALDPRESNNAQPAPRTVGPMDVLHLRFRDAEGEIVPALLCTPHGVKGPFRLVIAVHGLGSNKAQVCGQVAPALVRRGFAVLAPDMPGHGERPGDSRALLNPTNPLGLLADFRQAVTDVRQCIDLAEQRTDLDLSGGVCLAGYSMGSWINSVAGPADSRVRAMVLMVGGARDVVPAARSFPQAAALDPALAIAHFVGRPLLMLNAKADRVVTPAMSQRLFSAAAEPKKQIWFDGGHLLPERAYDTAAQWIADMVWPTAAAK